MYWRLLGLLIILCFIFLQEVVKAADSKENIYKVYENKRLLSDFLETLSDVYSSTECLMTCERYQNCQSMNFNALLNQCELLNIIGIDACTGGTTEIEDREGWIHYVNTSKQISLCTIKMPIVVVPIIIPILQDCLALYDAGYNESGVYNVAVGEVYCDQITDGGGWTVIQRRVNGSTNFYRNWTQYKNGFGNPHHELWLGNDKIYYLTMSHSSLFINITTASTYKTSWVHYGSFMVGTESTKYRLNVTNFSGNDEDRLAYHNGMAYSTFDQDNDENNSNCAKTNLGAWWYNNCFYSNLNGEYLSSRDFQWKTHLSFVEMKVRRNV